MCSLTSRAEWVEPIVAELGDNLTLYSMSSSGSGVLVAYIMNILNEHLPQKRDVPLPLNPLTYHRIVEAFKHGYAQRTKLGDPKYLPEMAQVS